MRPSLSGKIVCGGLISLAFCDFASGGISLSNVLVRPPGSLPLCGTVYASPIADRNDAVKPRRCPAQTKRTYSPTFNTIGQQILSAESDVCFVPDSAFEQLDYLIEQGRKRYLQATGDTQDWKSKATSFFEAMGATLLDSNYQLYIPTETLGDALVERHLRSGGRHIEDCDTASMIYLSAAEVLGLPVSMVEIELGSGAGHNYLRWTHSDGETLDWDTNGRQQCETPDNLPSWQGKTMSRSEVLGYTKSIRGLMNQKAGKNVDALQDYRESTGLYPRSPFAYNNLAWLIATRAEFDTSAQAQEAMRDAKAAVAIERSANYLDTLACAYARAGDFPSAINTAKEVIKLAPGRSEFQERLDLFQSVPPHNCVGVDEASVATGGRNGP